MAKATHIAVISVPVFSHQISIVEFCRRLVHLHGHFHITCIFPILDEPISVTVKLLKSLPSSINYTFLPSVKKEDLPQDVRPIVQIHHAVSQSMLSFRHALGSLCSTTPVAALVVDPFAKEALEIAKEFNLLSYIYFPPSTTTLSLFLHLPTLHENDSSEYKDLKEIQIPGCIPFQGRDLPEHLQDRSSLSYDFILESCKSFSLADGFLVNSFSKLEEGAERALQERIGSNNNTRVYLVGPILHASESNGLEYVRWLENQRPKSVLYVSFGSSGTLSQQQLNELALGLELSGQKFLWVLRAPSDYANITYPLATNYDPLQFLPQGFLERTKGQGLVIPFWAPQAQILSHTSTGGFITHCGWNSILESISLGVPMITWPLFGEQRMNAVLLTKGLKVALRPKLNENGIAERKEIAKTINDIMLGEERNGIRQRIEELKDAAADALKEDGSSTKALHQFCTQIENFASLKLK